MLQVSEDKDALYYPFIHVRDEAWLKATLLYFPCLFRMVPPGFELNDSPLAKLLSELHGARQEPMLRSYDLDSFEAYQAGERLAKRLQADLKNEHRFAESFSRLATLAAYKTDSSFQ